MFLNSNLPTMSQTDGLVCMLGLFLVLALGHYLADFALQSPWVAGLKSDVLRKDADPHAIHALTAHAAHHALVAVAILWAFGLSPWWALVIGISHWLIDLGKARFQLYSINVDQLLHFVAIAVVTVLA